MRNDDSVGEAPLPPSLRDAAGAHSFIPGGEDAALAVSAIALHEAGHAIVARYLGLPVAGVTLVASADYAGLCYGPDTDPSKVTPTVLREEAERRCNNATELLPLPGERRDCTASWVVHAQSLVMESVAGWAGEQLAGFNRELEAGSTDYTVARMYARSIVHSDEAVPSFVESCRADAVKILRDHWGAVEAVAVALDARKTLTGEEIDAIIYGAESKALHDAELRRRARMASAATHTRFFNRLREVLHYDPNTGIFKWLISTSNRVHIGDAAGSVNAQGYREIMFDGGRYSAHRLAWFYQTGVWPNGEIDHSNLDKTEHRWINLRYATHAQNLWNVRAPGTSITRNGVHGL